MGLTGYYGIVPNVPMAEKGIRINKTTICFICYLLPTNLNRPPNKPRRLHSPSWNNIVLLQKQETFRNKFDKERFLHYPFAIKSITKG